MKHLLLVLTLALASTSYADVTPGAKVTETPEGVATPRFSILDSDQDGVMRDKDQCLATPFNAKVDERGCAICPEASLSDSRGCYSENNDVVRIAINVQFATDSYAVSDLYQPEIERAAQLMLEHDIVSVTIEGHTDSVGSEQYNQVLSQNRAQAVADYLVRYGLDVNRIKAIGYGETVPAASNDTPEGRFENRRVIGVVEVNTQSKEYILRK